MFLSNEQRQTTTMLSFEANDINGSQIMTDTPDPLAAGPSVPPHPLGIKPLGNKYFHNGKNARDHLGSLQVLPDEMLMQLLEFLDQHALRLLGYTCRFLFAHCISDDLWKSIFLESELANQSSFEWLGTWRATLLSLPQDQPIQIDCGDVFSDVLHRPFVCSNISLQRFTANIPARNEIDRFKDLSYAEFAEKWSTKPFILTKYIQSWPAYQSWSVEKLLEYQYMINSHDESPLYLFDRKFAEKMGLQVGKEEGAAYWKPDCFGSDLFELLGPARPAHRWLIIGPERSGSTFHKDPNATSAWNAVIRGAKYWIMFPPAAEVPGVYVSQDNSEVTSPLSIAEWLLEFQAEARKLPQCREGICRAGEVLHVPSGWWHLVVNMEAGIALTQNFVPKSHLPEVLCFLKDKPEQISGFTRDIVDPYSLFVARLREEYPDLLEDGLRQLADRQAQKKRRWDLAVGNTVNEDEDEPHKKNSTGFSFGFGFGDEEKDEEENEISQ
ncbi:Clavaminate synthase-like protein [Podospora didyma]|uniref:Clavaminate synthase-like protein n=1 Tax=Podospora didyma TaxID=330526 RepID=A0AAE0P7B1_9PEZI|nr:Clavaminate synthase-like protein [Podospora didyma]